MEFYPSICSGSNGPGDGEPQAGPPHQSLTALEGLAQPRKHCGRHDRAGVRDAQTAVCRQGDGDRFVPHAMLEGVFDQVPGQDGEGVGVDACEYRRVWQCQVDAPCSLVLVSMRN